ncbi:ATP-binding protein [Aliikangiella sp. IMCC44359]|uniref:ATP-binding protein n=1 Tax=Aliikangiella sp. IMCC44359 TaxID=3459125 RepID=UPI00403AC699
MIIFTSFNSIKATPESPTSSAVIQTEKSPQWYASQVEKYARNAPNLALKFANESAQYLEKHPHPVSEIKILNESSYAYYFLGDYPKAMERAKKAEVLAQKNKLYKALARSKVLQGNVLQSISVHERALVQYKEAADYYRANEMHHLLSKVMVNLANTYYNAGQHSVAMSFYKQAEEADTKKRNRAKYFLGYANIYSEQNKIEKAILYYLKAAEDYKMKNDQIGQELSQSGLGWLYLKQKKPEKAMVLFDKALASARSSGRLFREVNMLSWKSEALLQLNRNKEALNIANQAVKIATQLSSKLDQILAYQAKALALEKLGNINEALQVYKLIIALNIEVKNKQVETQMAVMQAVFDLDNKNHQIDLLSSQNIIQELNLKQQQFMSLIIVITILFISITAFFFYYRRTQQKLLQEEQHVSIRLKELDNLKNQVMANTSHELRTPLNGIIGMTQLLLETSETLTEEDAEKIEVIKQCGTRLLSLVQDITDFSQLQARKLKLHPAPIDFLELVKEVKSLLAQIAKDKNLTIEIAIEENLPLLYADKKRLHQILLNLIGNAIKFSNNGVVSVVAIKYEKYARILISDEGIGIQKNKLTQIFQPFEQVDGSLTRENEGSGLGLPITRELLLLHQQDITIITERNKGTTFSFILPIANT